MKTSEQIKGVIRNISKKTGVNPNSLNEVSITKILNEILAIEIDADIEYKLIKLSPIRQEDVLSKAIERTSKYRGSFETALQYKEIVELFR